MGSLVTIVPAIRFPLDARIRRFPSLALLLSIALGAPVARAQGVVLGRNWQEATVGSELESYLRVLQVAGLSSDRESFSIRPFGPKQLERMGRAADGAGHPWKGQVANARGRWELSASVLRPSLQAIYNTSFPFGYNDGPVWAGRGLTTVVRAGVQVRAGPLSLQLDPIAFRAENDAFALRGNGAQGAQRLGDPAQPNNIDRPQRFGADPYSRMDLGNSTLMVALGPFAAGGSTASQWWGPARVHPLLLGDNAGGFPHAFIGISGPTSIGIGRVHGRIIGGGLERTTWARQSGPSRRMVTAVVGMIEPAFMPTLELGAARFIHRHWPTGGATAGDFLRPLYESFSASRDANFDRGGLAENQLASLFARYRPPRAGVAVYGEFARNDFWLDTRDIVVQPDQNSAYTVGAERAWRRGETLWSALVELVNARRTHLSRVRTQATMYAHSQIVEGHTHRGQVLGSAAVQGGSGMALRLNRYGATSTLTVAYDRIDQIAFQQAGTEADAREVMHAVQVERIGIGPLMDLGARVDFVYRQRSTVVGPSSLGVMLGASWVVAPMANKRVAAVRLAGP